MTYDANCIVSSPSATSLKYHVEDTQHETLHLPGYNIMTTGQPVLTCIYHMSTDYIHECFCICDTFLIQLPVTPVSRKALPATAHASFFVMHTCSEHL